MQRKMFFVSLIVLASMLIFSGTVFADDELPAQETPAEEAGVPAETEEPAAEAPPEMAQELVVLSGEEETPLAEDPSSPVQDAAEPAAAEEVAEPTPEVFLVDTDGNALDMATQPAGDPYWVSGGTYYSSVSNVALCYQGTSVVDGTCFISATPIQNAINLIADNSVGAPDDGFLVVEYGIYPDLVIIDGGLPGGYLNNLRGMTYKAGDLFPVLTKSITLMNLINGFTLDGFTINGGVIVNDSSGQFILENLTANITITDVEANNNTGSDVSGTGIYANNNKGSITLNRVTASGNTVLGVWIWNHAGHVNFTDVTTNDNGGNGAAIQNEMGKYNVTIKNSEFNHNGLIGGQSGSISIWSNGVVTMNGVIANNSNDTSGGTGIRVRSGGAILSNITADNNAGSGIYVQLRSGSLLLENALARNNSADGVRVELRDKDDNEIVYPANVTMKNVTASNNSQLGVVIWTFAGHVYFENVTANDNGQNGAAIFNDIGKYNITIKNSEFNHNGLTEEISGSLSIWSNGLVTLNGVIADDSNENYGGSGIRVRSGGATLRNVIANNNAGSGIYVQLRSGSLLLENAVAIGNASEGIRVELRDSSYNELFYPANVTMKYVNVNDNSGGGIWVKTRGAVTLSDCKADNNSGSDGIYIATSGAVRVVSTYANVNGGNGLVVEGIYTEVDYGGAFERVAMASPASITITNPTLLGWSNGFWNNGGAGIYLITQRAVAISNFDVGQNQNEGLYITGPYLYDPAQGFSVLLRSGAVTISASIPNNYNNANENSLGVSIYSAGNVSVSGLHTWENRYHALEIDTLGSITVRNLHDFRNGTDGGSNSVALYNDQAIGFMPITLTNITINENLGDWGGGLLAHSKGTITVNGLYMDGNNSMGAALGNAMAGKGNINISNVSINGSSNGDGLQAISNGAILLKNVHTSNNSGFGAYLGNESAPTAMVITMADCSFDNNGDIGVQALSKGAITANRIIANGNGNGGIVLINDYGPFGVNVASLTADGNNGTGIYVQTNGSILANSIMALNNAKTVGGLTRYETTQDYFNYDRGPDRWWFYAEEGESYTLLMQADGYGIPGPLNRWEIDPYLELYDEEGNIVNSITFNHVGEVSYQIDWTVGSGKSGWYYLEASADADGFYRVSFDDSSPDDTEAYYWVSGFSYNAGGNLVVSGSSMLKHNSLTGLIGSNSGSVALSNLTVKDNGTEGVYVDNSGGAGNVTLSGNNMLSGNGWEGLRIETNGVVNLANVNVSNNGQSGAYIRANGIGKAVTLLNIISMENSLKGLDIESYGLTTLNNIRAWFNGTDGAEVDTHGYNLKLMNSTFMRNNCYGFSYWDYNSPFVFTNTNNIFLGNGCGQIRVRS